MLVDYLSPYGSPVLQTLLLLTGSGFGGREGDDEEKVTSNFNLVCGVYGYSPVTCVLIILYVEHLSAVWWWISWRWSRRVQRTSS